MHFGRSLKRARFSLYLFMLNVVQYFLKTTDSNKLIPQIINKISKHKKDATAIANATVCKLQA